MKQGHIYIYGDIINAQGNLAADFGIVSLSSVVHALQANRDCDELIVHINSRGGDVIEGFAIHDALKSSGKKIITRIEGICYSIATVVSLSGEEREAFPNARFGIHNPYGGVEGEADDILRYGEKVKEYEKKILDFYVTTTGAAKETIEPLMKSDTEMSVDQALELKFITKIHEPAKAFAMINSLPIKNNHISMFEDIKKMLGEFAAEIKAAFKHQDTPILNLTLTSESGQSLEIKTDSDKPAVGDEVSIDGSPAPDGEYPMPDKTTIVVSAGKISEIKPTEEESDDANAKALAEKDAEIQALKDQLATAQASATEATEAVTALKTEFEEIKNLTSQYIPKAGAPPFNKKDEPGETKSKTLQEYKDEAEAREKEYKNKQK